MLTSVCPPLVSYSPETLRGVAEELQKSPNSRKLIKDYANLREACRFIEKEAEKRTKSYGR